MSEPVTFWCGTEKIRAAALLPSVVETDDGRELQIIEWHPLISLDKAIVIRAEFLVVLPEDDDE